ncbi:MAG: YeeE/YedE family protein [Proteobacteria bacterium]|nr:YeeE/YedE family protein [Pseudomonadota bacterium]
MELKRSQYTYVFLSALMMGSGIAIAGFTNPDKILRFLDVSGPEWDPSLMWTMLFAVIVYALFYSWIKKRGMTFFATPYSPPHASKIGPRLLLGSIIFGLGWALSGLCPAPAIMRLVTLNMSSLIFVVAMFIGFKIARE